MSACSITTNEREALGIDGRDLREISRSTSAADAPDHAPIPLGGGDGGGETRALKWTSELPAEPGHYWVQIAHYPARMVEVQRRGFDLVVVLVFGVVRVQHYGSGDTQVLKAKHRWAGPLHPPAVAP